MAVAGDVVIKLAADFAEFAKGMDESIKKLHELGEKAAKSGDSISGMFSLMKQGIAALGIGAAVHELAAYTDELQRSAANLDTLAKTYGLTTDALQAYQFAATESGQRTDAITDIYRRFNVALGEAQLGGKLQIDTLNRLGVTILDVNGKLKPQADILQQVAAALLKLPEGAARAQAEIVLLGKSGQDANVILEKLANNSLPALIDRAKAAGVVLGSEYVEQAAKFQTATEILTRQIDVLASKLFLTVKGSFMEAAAAEATRLTNALQAMSAYDSLLDKLLVVFGGKGTLTGPNATLDMYSRTVDELNQKLPKLNDELTKLQANTNIPAGPKEQLTKNLQERITAAEDQRDYLSALISQKTMPPITVAAPTPTPGSNPAVVGGGKTDADSIEAQIRRYKVLEAAARDAQKTISTSQAQNVDDLKREVTVQQQVDDIVGKLLAKHIKVTEAEKERLRVAVTGAEQQRAAEQKLLEQNVAAEALEIKMGDGTKALAKAERDLTNEKNTGRLSSEAYSRSLVEQKEAIALAADAAKRYDDNLGSLAAGFDQAARQYARSNDMFTLGQQTFNGLTTAMGESLDTLVGKSTKSFGQIASDFASMLAKMALQAALSPVFKMIGSGISGLLTPTPASADTIMGLIPRAGGGPVSAGQAYLVGERGPEAFVPAGAGQIRPLDASGGAVTVNLDLRGQQTATGNDPASAMAFGRKVKAAVNDVIQTERMPGGSLYRRVTA